MNKYTACNECPGCRFGLLCHYLQEDVLNRESALNPLGDGRAVMKDMINHPDHYTYSSIEPIDVIEAWGLQFHLGNALKYISRAGKKDPNKTLEDIKKAKWYIDRYISVNETK
jgi:hypothetical protein